MEVYGEVMNLTKNNDDAILETGFSPIGVHKESNSGRIEGKFELGSPEVPIKARWERGPPLSTFRTPYISQLHLVSPFVTVPLQVGKAHAISVPVKNIGIPNL